jgi:hypothetical protein
MGGIDLFSKKALPWKKQGLQFKIPQHNKG